MVFTTKPEVGDIGGPQVPLTRLTGVRAAILPLLTEREKFLVGTPDDPLPKTDPPLPPVDPNDPNAEGTEVPAPVTSPFTQREAEFTKVSPAQKALPLIAAGGAILIILVLLLRRRKAK